MRANAKTLAAAAFMAAAIQSAPAGAEDTCSALALQRPKAVADTLRTLSAEVFGKRADAWTRQDFANVIANAEACDGKPEGMRTRVNASQWRHHMNAASEIVLQVSARNDAIREAYSPRWTWGDVPSCASLLDWRRDSIWNTDNSKEIFGIRLRIMTDEQRTLAAGLAGECVPVMESVLKAHRIQVSQAQAVADDIKASAQREGKAAAEDPDEVAPSLRAEHDGERVPLAYIGEASRRMVAVASHAEKTGYRLSTEQLIMLSKWADKVRSVRLVGPERLYADKVQEFVRVQMFDSRKK